MKDPKRKLNGSKSLAPEARWWLDQGVRPIPIKPRSKRPAAGEGWNQQRISREQIEEVFKPGMNLGALWGKPSKDAIDVDIDNDAAVRIAASILPRNTGIYGTEVREESHYVYTCPGAKTHKWLDPETKETIIELRSTGSQSVLPGSTHPDGHHYKWDSQKPFLKISVGKLHSLCARIAGLTLLAKHYPKSGARHDYVHAVTGSLLHSGAAPSEARVLVSALLDAVGRKETDRAQRERAIENTISGHKRSTTHGWRTLSEYVPAAVLERCKQWFKFRNVGAEVTIVHSDRTRRTVDDDRAVKSERPRTESAPLPSLGLPGLVGDIARWSGRRSMVKQPLFDLAVGFWCTALATGNRYKVGAGYDTPLQPYFMLLAPTSGGKDNAADAAFEFARRCDLRDNVFSGFQSYHVLADKISATPSIAGWIWDEAARHLKSSSRPGSQDYQVLTWLMKLYGKASTSTPGLPARNEASSIPSIDFPFFVTLATAQPGPFIEAISSAQSAFDTGLMNRFILFDAGDTDGGFNEQKETIFPSAIKKKVELFKEIPLPLEDRPQRIITVDHDAYLRFKEFRDEAHRRSKGEDAIDTLWGRANQNALILAGLIAVGIDHKKPKITKTETEWAIKFMRWSIATWSARLDGSVSRNYTEANSKKVEAIIRDAKKFAGKATRPVWHKLLSQGLMPVAFLMQKSRYLRGNELRETLESLEQAGIITLDETDSGSEFAKWNGK